LSDEKYFVVAEEYSRNGEYIDQVVLKGSEKDCCDYAMSISSGGGDNQYRDVQVLSEEEYDKEYGSGNMMRQPYKLHLKDYHEFSWVVAALNFFVTYGDTNLGDCYYDKEECKKTLDRLQEEFLEYFWEVCKQKDYDGKEYCAFEENYCADPDDDFMCYYYNKEKAKERAKSWNFCNTTSDANAAKISMGLNDIHIEQCLHDLNLYGTACERVLTRDEIEKVLSHSNVEYKKWLRTHEGQEWINSDD
tara:strand:- start:79 stop:819 length:741 start_codon:yes stop_codon:yes gene_type:complete